MALTLHTLTLRKDKVPTDIPDQGTFELRPRTDNHTLNDVDGHRVWDGVKRAANKAGGVVWDDIPALPQPGIEPADATWELWWYPAGSGTPTLRWGPFILDGDKTLDELNDPAGVPVTPSVLTEAQAARDEAVDAAASATTAAASVQREQAGGVAGLTTAGKLYEARIPDRLSDASLTAAYAPALFDKAFRIATHPRYGVKADCHVSYASITLTAGSTAATLNIVESRLTAGQTLVIEGVGTYVVASVTGLNVTLTTPAATSATKRFAHGTDNTAGFNAFFADILANPAIGVVPSGRYLVTGTIGVPEPGPADGLSSGLTVLWGGTGYSATEATWEATNRVQGVSIAWGGPAGGILMQLSRLIGPRFIGGLALFGQFTYGSGATRFGNVPSILLHVSQNGTPWSGTSQMTFADVALYYATTGLQFGTNLGDNNADVSIVERLYAWQIDDAAIRVKHTQGLGYRFGLIRAGSCPKSVLKFEDGGAVEVGTIALNNCGGGATADPTADSYAVDFASSVDGYSLNVGMIRAENGTKRVACVRNVRSHLRIGSFTEGQFSVDDCLFFIKGGTLEILSGQMRTTYATGRRAFYLANDVNSRPPRLRLNELVVPNTEPNSFLYLSADPNVMADISITALHSDGSAYRATYPEFHTQLAAGPVPAGGSTTDATTTVTLDPFNKLAGLLPVYSQGPRVPVGTSVIDLNVVADHGNATPSVFRRRVTVYRPATGAATVIGLETIGTDIVSGTDAIASVAVPSATYFVLQVGVKGTAATTVNWRATMRLVTRYRTAAVDPV